MDAMRVWGRMLSLKGEHGAPPTLVPPPLPLPLTAFEKPIILDFPLGKI